MPHPTGVLPACPPYRGQPDLAIGSVVGSSLLNLLLILGVVGLFSGSAGVAVPALLLAFLTWSVVGWWRVRQR